MHLSPQTRYPNKAKTNAPAAPTSTLPPTIAAAALPLCVGEADLVASAVTSSVGVADDVGFGVEVGIGVEVDNPLAALQLAVF